MAVRAVVPGRTNVHVFSGDKPDPRLPDQTDEEYQEVLDAFQPTKWNLKALDSRLLGVLKDKNARVTVNVARPDDEVGTIFNQNEYSFTVCQLGLDEPENFDGPVKFKRTKRPFGGQNLECVHPDFVATIPQPVIAELAEKIEALNTLTGEEGKA